MEDKNRIGEFLAELRNEKGYTQEKLASKIHVTNKAISNWENGRSRPDPDMMKTLANFFNVTVDELYAGARRDTKEVLFKRKIKKICILTSFSIFIIIFLLLLTYFVLTINSVKFYVLDIDDDSINTTGGYYIVSKNKSILHFNKLELDSNLEDNAYIELYEKNFDENIILYSGFCSTFDLWNVVIDNIDEIYLKVVYQKDDETCENIYKITFYPKYMNHKFVNLASESSINYENNSTNNNELVDKLLELGFEEQSENLYFKEVKTKKEKITTYIDTNIYTYNKIIESKDNKKLISHFQGSESLIVQFLDAKDNIYKEFRYELEKNMIICIIGRCNDVSDVESIKEDIEIVKLFK